VGGVAAISVAAVAIGFFLRRRRRRSEAAAPVAPPVFGPSQPPMDEIQQPLTMDDGYTSSSIPGTIGSSLPGTPVVPMRFYVRVSCPITRRASMCAYRVCFLTHSFPLTLRTRMTRLRSLGTKEFRRQRPRLLKDPHRRSMEQETPRPRCRPYGHRVTTACLLSDFALRSHRITEKSESGMPTSVILSEKSSLLYICQLQLRSWVSLYFAVGYLYPDRRSIGELA